MNFDRAVNFACGHAPVHASDVERNLSGNFQDDLLLHFAVEHSPQSPTVSLLAAYDQTRRALVYCDRTAVKITFAARSAKHINLCCACVCCLNVNSAIDARDFNTRARVKLVSLANLT